LKAIRNNSGFLDAYAVAAASNDTESSVRIWSASIDATLALVRVAEALARASDG
jgi:hypothetical protein